MEQWEREVFGHMTQPPAFKISDVDRQKFKPLEDAVNARLAQPPAATHLHHDREIAKPAISTRHRVSVAQDGHPTQASLN